MKDRKRKRKKYLAANKQRSSIHRFSRGAIIGSDRKGVAKDTEKQRTKSERHSSNKDGREGLNRAGSKQRNQSSLNELLIISRTRRSGKGNWPYNGGVKCATRSCGEPVVGVGKEAGGLTAGGGREREKGWYY